ncbi:retrovirus-related pol polyprotein from transposon TNT 1-94 [Tanacetum coccineum]
MDSIIPLGQKNTLAQYMILPGANNRPPMLDKDLIKKYAELSATEKIQADCDLKVTNIILQGLPYDVYSLVNHHKVAKDLWEKVQLLMQGTRANTSGTVGNYSGQQRVVKCFNCQGEGHMARQCPKTKQKRDVTWFRDKVLLVKAKECKVRYEENWNSWQTLMSTAKAVLMANSSSYGSYVLYEIPYSEQTHLVNYPENEITSESNIIPYSQYLLETQNAAVQDTNSSAQQDAMILSVFEQLSQHVTNCNKVNKDNQIAKKTLYGELERYKEWVKLLEERQNVDLGTREKLIIDDIIRDKDAQFADFEKEINSLKQTLSKQLKEKESLTKTFNVSKNESKEKEAKNIDNEIALKKKVKELDNIVHKMGQSAQTVHMLTKPQVFYDNNPKQALGFKNTFYLKKAQQIRPMLYDGSVIAKETNVISVADSEETLMLEEESRSKMLLKQSDSKVLEKKVNIKPINYAKLNRLSEDFGKRFVPQQELSDEQAFQLQTSHPNTKQSTSSPVKIEAPWELPKVSLVNTSLKKLKYHLGQFDNVVKKRITSDALTEGEWGFEHTKAVFLKEIIPFVKTLKDIFNIFDKDLLNEVTEVQTVFNQMDAAVQHIKNDLRKFKGKDIVDNVAQGSNDTTIALGMYKLDRVTLAPKDKNNRETHIYYLKHTMEQAAILREIVEQAKSLNPLDSASYSACKYVKLIQELLGYVRDTCPDIHKPSEKLGVVTPINKKKTVRFVEPVISSSTSQKQLSSSQTMTKQTTNNSVSTSTGVSQSTKSSRSKSIANTKNDRILQISSSTQKKNKVEDHSRIVKSSLNKSNYVVEPSGNANVQHFKLNTNSELISKSKSVKKAKKKEEWKPTGKYLDSGCSKHMTGDRSQLTNFVHKFLGTVKFGNDQIAKIMGYGDYQIGNITILRVFYMEGLGHNLFSIGQFCDSDLEVAFRKHMCFVRNLEGDDLLSGSQETSLYTLSIGYMMAYSPICLLSKASKTKS